ncbi:MAG: hypothetical protein ABSC19_20335, partial [Syntrophorhabdales bacterium]
MPVEGAGPAGAVRRRQWWRRSDQQALSKKSGADYHSLRSRKIVGCPGNIGQCWRLIPMASQGSKLLSPGMPFHATPQIVAAILSFLTPGMLGDLSMSKPLTVSDISARPVQNGKSRVSANIGGAELWIESDEPLAPSA